MKKDENFDIEALRKRVGLKRKPKFYDYSKLTSNGKLNTSYYKRQMKRIGREVL